MAQYCSDWRQAIAEVESVGKMGKPKEMDPLVDLTEIQLLELRTESLSFS